MIKVISQKYYEPTLAIRLLRHYNKSTFQKNKYSIKNKSTNYSKCRRSIRDYFHLGVHYGVSVGVIKIYRSVYYYLLLVIISYYYLYLYPLRPSKTRYHNHRPSYRDAPSSHYQHTTVSPASEYHTCLYPDQPTHSP